VNLRDELPGELNQLLYDLLFAVKVVELITFLEIQCLCIASIELNICCAL
jgi:hypothetical protein